MMNEPIGTWLVLAFVSGCFGIYVDKRCHRSSSGQEGFWHGLFLGPFGWILVALYPSNPHDRPKQQ